MDRSTLLVGLVAGLFVATRGTSQVVTYETHGTVPIPDGSSATMEIIVNDPGTVFDVDVGVIITHTWQGEVIATIEHVGVGKVATIINRPGGTGQQIGFSADNFGNFSTGSFMIFDDEAANVYDTPFVPAFGINNVTGSWQPDGPLTFGVGDLEVFDGQNIAGTWRLRVSTLPAPLDLGTIRALQLTFTIPGPMSLGPLMLAGLLMRRHRRRDR